MIKLNPYAKCVKRAKSVKKAKFVPTEDQKTRRRELAAALQQ